MFISLKSESNASDDWNGNNSSSDDSSVSEKRELSLETDREFELARNMMTTMIVRLRT